MMMKQNKTKQRKPKQTKKKGGQTKAGQTWSRNQIEESVLFHNAFCLDYFCLIATLVEWVSSFQPRTG